MKVLNDVKVGVARAFQDRNWLALVGGLALFDQITKLVVLAEFALHETVQVIPGLFNLVYVQNFGAAFGILAGINSPLREVLLLTATALALCVVFAFLGGLEPGRGWGSVALGLVCGGAIGNLIDRVRLGYVVDFLDFHIGEHHWPAFNVADSCICIGVAILIFVPKREFLRATLGDETKEGAKG